MSVQPEPSYGIALVIYNKNSKLWLIVLIMRMGGLIAPTPGITRLVSIKLTLLLSIICKQTGLIFLIMNEMKKLP
jgi:hypothetical protein